MWPFWEGDRIFAGIIKLRCGHTGLRWTLEQQLISLGEEGRCGCGAMVHSVSECLLGFQLSCFYFRFLWRQQVKQLRPYDLCGKLLESLAPGFSLTHSWQDFSLPPQAPSSSTILPRPPLSNIMKSLKIGRGKCEYRDTSTHCRDTMESGIVRDWNQYTPRITSDHQKIGDSQGTKFCGRVFRGNPIY